MEYIFIDTSIFESNNFLESNRINEILKLAEEKYITIVLPAVTYNEVKNRAIKNIKEATSKFRSYRDSTRVLRNISSLASKFEKFDEDVCITEFLEVFDSRLQNAHVQIVDYPKLNIKDVFDKYFNSEFPFSKGEKKSEFPDAFALLSIEHWCKNNHKKCFVFSHDKDLLNYKSEFLDVISSYEEYLDKLLRQVENDKQRQGRIENVNKVYKLRKQKLETEVAKWLFSQLLKHENYQKHSDINIYDIIVNEADAKLKTLQIISITDEEIIVETKAEVFYNVELEIEDYGSTFLGNNDRNLYATDTEYVVFNSKKIIPVQLKIVNPITDPNSIKIYLDLVNHGKSFYP